MQELNRLKQDSKAAGIRGGPDFRRPRPKKRTGRAAFHDNQVWIAAA